MNVMPKRCIPMFCVLLLCGCSSVKQVILGGFREILGSGTLFGLTVMPEAFDPWMVMILPPGAFLGLGFFIAITNWINDRRSKA